ncbi:MAG: amino acid permease [Acidobacteria bacterium]|nr:MAG: amino acid permease [Acidobacteriota bacterium]
MAHDQRKIGLLTAACVVISNMIGTGVFTTLGFQAAEIRSVFALLLLWLLGGIVALSGALCYAELAVRMPRSGGEYTYLSRIFHPAVGFVAGWVSATVGFAAPAALASVALGNYLATVVPAFSPLVVAVTAIIVATIVHAAGIKVGSLFQDFLTGLNVTLILFLIACGFLLYRSSHFSLTVTPSDIRPVLTPVYAVSLVYVLFAYSGWNGATYIAGEVKDPARNLPRSLVIGTLIVTFLYLALNATFLYTVPVSELAGKVEVAFLSARRIFGQAGAQLMTVMLCVALGASSSAFILAGSRVARTMGEDFRRLRFLAITNQKGTPIPAILSQAAVALLLVLTSAFENVLVYVGFTLSVLTTLTVIGLLRMRQREGPNRDGYNTWFYPFTPVIFLLLSLWMLLYSLVNRPVQSLLGLGTVLSGLVVFLLAGPVRQPGGSKKQMP